jgi:DNA repair protein RecN (Recombination protein N)
VLEELRISGLGVIDDAVLELSPGLTVVTGETGAGKTMVVSGLGLLFGGRGDAGLVRVGSARAAVDGRLRIPPGRVADMVDELGGDLDDHALLLSRVVGADGRSRAQVGGRSVPVGTLAELAEELIAVHGQTDQLRLRSPARQRDAIDRFGGDDVAHALGAYRDVYRRYQDVEATLTELTTRARPTSCDLVLPRSRRLPRKLLKITRSLLRLRGSPTQTCCEALRCRRTRACWVTPRAMTSLTQ